jgi:selenoprotein W-related protein
MKPHITIEYCPQCGWLMRAAWMAQEFLTTFSEEIGEVSLRPSAIAGSFRIEIEGEVLFDRKEKGAFPEIKYLKQTLRDKIAPNKNLGHADAKKEG